MDCESGDALADMAAALVLSSKAGVAVPEDADDNNMDGDDELRLILF